MSRQPSFGVDALGREAPGGDEGEGVKVYFSGREEEDYGTDYQEGEGECVHCGFVLGFLVGGLWGRRRRVEVGHFLFFFFLGCGSWSLGFGIWGLLIGPRWALLILLIDELRM